MNLVEPVPALLAGLAIFFVPGLMALALLSREDRDALELDEALFLVVAVSVLVAAWVGLVLAEAGRFSLVTAGAALAVLSLAAGVLWRARWAWPLRRPRSWTSLVPAAVVLALAFGLQARPSEYLVGGRDPGTYVAAMALIGRTGGIVYTDPAVRSIPKEDVELFYRNPKEPDFTWARFMGFPLERPESGRVFPEFFHLFPVFGAYFFQAMGVKGALATPPVFGILGTLSVFFAFRRIFGPAPALLAVLLLGLNVLQVWFARYPLSETASQFLLFLALLAVAHWEERRSPFFGVLAGAALGVSLLVRIDSVLVVLPLGLYVIARRAARDVTWKQFLTMLVPFGLLTLHAVIHAVFWSWKYVQAILDRPYWKWPAVVWVSIGVAGVAAFVLLERWGPVVFHTITRHRARIQSAVAATIVLASLYASFLRPRLSAWAGADGYAATKVRVTSASTEVRQSPSAEGRTLFTIGRGDALGVVGETGEFYYVVFGGKAGYVHRRAVDDPAAVPQGSPVPPRLLHNLGFHRLAAHDAESFIRLGWFVTPLGLALGVLGLLLAVGEWRSRYLFLLLATLCFSAFYFYKLRVWHDYFFAARRFIPLTLPCTLGFAALFLCRLARRRGWRGPVAAAVALGLAFAFVRETRAIFRHVDWTGSVRFVNDLARRFGPEDVVIFEQYSSIHLLSLPLWAVHGVHILELARWDPDPAKLEHLIRDWRGRYRHIYFVYTYRARPGLCGIFLQRIEDLLFPTLEWRKGYTSPPREPEGRELRFTVSRLLLPEDLKVPPLDEVDIGGSDDFQVSGFFEKEGSGDQTYRWTGPCGLIYAPGVSPGASIRITTGVGRRPSTSPALVRVSLGGTELGRFVATPDWCDTVLRLPSSLPPGPPILRLDVRDLTGTRDGTWRPVNVDGESDDVRDLGVMVDRVRIMSAPDAGGRIHVSSPTGGGS